MKKWLFALVFCLGLVWSYSQKMAGFQFDFDHESLSVSNLDASAKFYGEVLGLKEIEDAAHNPAIRWFVFKNGIQLHLITGDNSKISLTKSVHMSFAVKHFDQFVKYLEEKGIPYSDWVGASNKIAQRPDGVRQVYIQDPDGYWIEINDHKRR